jgi:fumarate reductase flavoprotein subunit
MKRRTLLSGALSIGPLISLAPLVGRAAPAAGWDFIVVGAGTAGLAAGIFASRRGARVLLIDAADDVGGTLHMANGQVSAAGSRIQVAKGIEDTPDLHFEDVIRLSKGLSDRDIIRTTVDHAPRTVNWLLDNGLTPLPEHPLTGSNPGAPAYSVPRYLWSAQEGPAILAVVRQQLQPELASGRMVTQLNTRVTSLKTDSKGAVIGVRARHHGADVEFDGRHVLLTSGGYCMNPELFKRLTGVPNFSGGAYPHSQGDGLELATSVGGWLRGSELHRAGTGNILTANEFPARVYGRFNTSPQARLPWEIWVNDRGERFIREDEPVNYERAMVLLKQPGLRYRIIFDQEILDRSPLGLVGWTKERMLEHFNTHPMFHKADSLEALAGQLDMDAGALNKTVKAYNAGVRRGSDELGREHLPLPIKRGPFYAVTHLGSSATSAAGIVVDEHMRVMRGNGEPVPNLYAAGEALGSGSTLGNNFVPGFMLTPALVLGRLLGERLPIGDQRSG